MENFDAGPDRYGLVGHPVQHSRSPQIHAMFAEQTGDSISYELIDADPDGFDAAVLGFRDAGGKGLNVTVPHKEAAYRLADEHGDAAARAGAVNTLSFNADRIRGDNTDGIGLIRDLTINHGFRLDGRRVIVLGAGGAARGILGPLLESHPAEFWLANRTLERAEQLQQAFGGDVAVGVRRFDRLADLGAFDLVVNATSAGLHGEQPPFPASLIGPSTFCYDLSYSKQRTPFDAWARSLGAARSVQGWGMLVEQAAESYRIWRGRRPETAEVLARIMR